MSNLKITIVSTKSSWINIYIERFISRLEKDFQVSWVFCVDKIQEGDIAFFLGFEEVVSKGVLKKHKNNIVVHESDLPKGKGMSPMTWQILEGKKKIPITLFEMVEKLDSGRIYLQDMITVNDTDLIDEIRSKQAESTFSLCQSFLDCYPDILNDGKKQKGVESFYRARTPEDSALNIHKTIVEQFNLLRIVDKDRYPAFFDYQGVRYFLNITKDSGEIKQ